MGQTVSFDYFYGGQSDAFSYYRIPRLLITAPQFKGMSTDAKLLYGLLLDRMGLSSRNGWYDEQGRVYIYYALDEIQRDLNCGHDKAVKLLPELDSGKGIGPIACTEKDSIAFVVAVLASTAFVAQIPLVRGRGHLIPHFTSRVGM